jgi:hypothetical protein
MKQPAPDDKRFHNVILSEAKNLWIISGSSVGGTDLRCFASLKIKLKLVRPVSKIKIV